MTLGNLSGGAHCPCDEGAAAAAVTAADAPLGGTLLLPAPLPANPPAAGAAPPSLSPRGHQVVAVCLGSIGALGFLSNLLVLALFARCRALRTPMNLLLVSISASDLLVNVLGTPFSFAASTQGRWLIGRAGCVWYGFVNACLGEQSPALRVSVACCCCGCGCFESGAHVMSQRDLGIHGQCMRVKFACSRESQSLTAGCDHPQSDRRVELLEPRDLG